MTCPLLARLGVSVPPAPAHHGTRGAPNEAGGGGAGMGHGGESEMPFALMLAYSGSAGPSPPGANATAGHADGPSRPGACAREGLLAVRDRRVCGWCVVE